MSTETTKQHAAATSVMRAVAFTRSLDVSDPDALSDIEVPRPSPTGNDILVEVRAVSVNPVDGKIRAGGDSSEPRVLGFDAAGVVVEVGDAVTLFAPGDEVWYAGDSSRPGTNSELHLVDERIVSRKPTTMRFAEAAALPLTAITAWEGLFDKLKLDERSRGTLYVPGASGGVGSMVLQLAVAAPHGIDWIFTSRVAEPGQLELYVSVLNPFGEIVAIDDPNGLDIGALKSKSLSFHWELMFTRPLAGGDIQLAQHHLLGRVAELVDAGQVRSTATTVLQPINAEQLREAHRLVQTGRTIGKVVVSN